MNDPIKTEPVLGRIAVVGAGAVGCYYGGMLARAGHEVVLIGREQHVRAIEADGLHLETQTFDEHVRLDASTDASAVKGASLVLFCVKSTDTETTARQIAPYLAANTLILTLQNGVDNDERVRAVLANEVAAAVVYVASEMAGPGHVRHHGRGELVIAPSTRDPLLASRLIAAGIPTEVSADVKAALWSKLILNCAYNALSAIGQLPYGALVKGQGIEVAMKQVVDECVAVAHADGIRLQGDVAAAVRRIADTMPGQYSSTAQDLARGKTSEIDHLNGYVAARGNALGIATPSNQLLHALVKLIEAKRAAKDSPGGRRGRIVHTEREAHR
jgi:2-dehydropantoate 2-reductase